MISKNEFKRFLDILSLKKIINFGLTYLSYYISKFSGYPIVLHRPFTLSFEPTTQCNLGCPECPSGLKKFSRNTGNAELETFERVLVDAHKSLLFVYLYFQGEPFINKHFSKMIALAKKYKVFTITSTNGHYLTNSKCEEIIQSGLDRILISIDGAKQETYEQYRRQGSLEKVVAGTKTLVETKKRMGASNPEIVFQMLVVKPNENEISDVVKLAEEIGVDQLVLKTAQVYDFENGNDLIPSQEKYSRYKRVPNGKWKIKNDLKNQCWKMWHSAVITWDGKMIPCCFDKDAKYTMGNILNEPLKLIWNNLNYNEFRKNLLQSRKAIDICQNCSEGTKVWEVV